MAVLADHREYSVVWRLAHEHKDRRIVYRDKAQALRRVAFIREDAFCRLKPNDEPRLETRTVGAWEVVDV